MAKMQYVKSVSVPKHVWGAINVLIDRVHAIEDKLGLPEEVTKVMDAIATPKVAEDGTEFTEVSPLDHFLNKKEHKRKGK